jgi:hypothetical protein
MRTPLASLLALALAACGPGDPVLDTGDTEPATTDPDPTEFVPTTGPTEPAPTTGDTSPTGGPADMCGPCDTIFEGDVSPSSNTQIDGLVVAARQIRDAIVTVEGTFATDLRALADTYGLPPDAATAELVAAIQADLAANTTAFQVVHAPSRCASDTARAALAQAACEVNAGCDVALPAAPPPVQCEGLCLGPCDGLCEGDNSCSEPAPGVACEGLCHGTCLLAAPAACPGDCRGDCLGTCSVFTAEGACAGRCDGTCAGACDLPVPTACDGACSGTCLIEQGSAQCTGAGPCRGQCTGECAGECAGHPTPPAASADCTATALCSPQATAQASAALRCTPPALDLQFTLKLGLDDAAAAQFVTRIAILERRGASVLQGAAHLNALVNGEVAGQLVFVPSPIANLAATFEALISAGLTDLTIPELRLPCVIPALQAAQLAVADAAQSAADTLAAQAQLAALLTGD